MYVPEEGQGMGGRQRGCTAPGFNKLQRQQQQERQRQALAAAVASAAAVGAHKAPGPSTAGVRKRAGSKTKGRAGGSRAKKGAAVAREGDEGAGGAAVGGNDDGFGDALDY
jgi:hypothetical protein